MWCFFVAQLVLGQTFSGTGGALGFFGAANYSIPVTGLGNLDGVNLGVESIEITLDAKPLNAARLYLIAPDDTRVVLIDGMGGTNVNGTIKFNMDPSAPRIRDWAVTSPPPNTFFRPYVSLNGFSNGQSASGTWTLQGASVPFGKSVSIASWKITFGKNFIGKAEPNDECLNATKLTEGTALTEIRTDNFSSNKNDITGGMVGATAGDYTENTAWYSFVPQCKDDKITIENSDNTGAQTAIRGSCRSDTASLASYKLGAVSGGFSYTYNYTKYTQGKTYFIVIDGDNANYVYLKKILWEKGTIGCSVAATIATGTISNTNPYCAGQRITVPYTITGTFNSGNVFAAQLSDGNGSFTTPVNIGTLASVASGNIDAAIPTNTLQGTKYKIRVVSSNVAVTGSANGLDLQINNLPSTIPNFISGATTVCENQKNVSYQVSTNSPNTIEWKLPTGATITTTNTDQSSIAISYTSNGGNLEARYKNSCGVGNASIKTITLNKKPSATTLISGASTICANAQNIAYKATLVNSATKYQWKLPNGATVASATTDSSEIKVNFGNTGGQITATASNECGWSAPLALDISLGTLPAAPAGLAIPTEVCSGDMDVLLSVNAVVGTIFKWQLPAGFTINNSNTDSSRINIKAGNAGGDISVAAYNGCGENTQKATGNIQILPLPSKPIILASPTLRCTNLSNGIMIELKADANTTYFQWQFPLGYSKIVSVTADSAKVQALPSSSRDKISVRAKNNCGTSSPIVIPIILDSVPATPSLVYNEKVVCTQDPNTATVVVNPKTGVSHTWLTSSSLDISAAPADSSSINISLKPLQKVGIAQVFAINRCGKSLESASFVLKMVDQPASLKMTFADTAICTNSKANFKASAINGGDSPIFSWYVNDVLAVQGSDSVFTTPNLSANAVVYCSMQSSLPCATPNPIRTALYTVKVSAAVTPSVFIASADTNLCEGNTTTFIARAANAGLPQYAWYINDILQQGATSESFRPTTLAGNDMVKATATSSLECASVATTTSAAITINVVSGISPILTIASTKDSICAIENVAITAKPLNAGNSYSLSWFINNKLVAATSNSIEIDTLTQSSAIYAQLKTTQPCATATEVASNTQKISVIAKPILATNITGASEVCKGDSGKIYVVNELGNNSYLWQVPAIAQGQSSRSSISLTFENIGIDTLKVAALNRCGSSNISFLVINVNACMPIFIPNVFSTVGDIGWSIEGLEEFNKAEISVFNRWGNQVYFSQGYSKKWDGKYQSKQLPVGTYYFILNLNDKANRVFTGSVTILHE